jgi:hypothetical protein
MLKAIALTGGSEVIDLLVVAYVRAKKEHPMQGYRPDWLGAIIAGVLIALSMLVATAVVRRKQPQGPRPSSRRAIVLAGLIGVALAFIVNLVRHRI